MCFRCILFEMTVKYLSGDIQQVVGYASLELRVEGMCFKIL